MERPGERGASSLEYAIMAGLVLFAVLLAAATFFDGGPSAVAGAVDCRASVAAPCDPDGG